MATRPEMPCNARPADRRWLENAAEWFGAKIGWPDHPRVPFPEPCDDECAACPLAAEPVAERIAASIAHDYGVTWKRGAAHRSPPGGDESRL